MISCHRPLGMSWVAWVEPPGKPCAWSYGAPLGVVYYICIDAGPVNCFSALGLLFFIPGACCGCQQGHGQGAWGTQMWSPFWIILASMASSSWALQKCWVILRTCLRWSHHPLSVKWYLVLYTRLPFTTPLMTSSLSVDSWICWIFWCMAMCRTLWEGKWLELLANTISLLGLYWMGVVILLHAKKHVL